MRKLLLLAPLMIAAVPGTALAQTSNTSTKNVGVIGTAPAMCFAGTVSGTGSYPLGVLIDTATGQLRSDLSAPPQVLVGSFCTGRSTITVAATPLAAQNSTVAPPSGFSRQVDYTATASGWTTTPASYTTGASSQPAATQTRASAFTGDITVAISNFSTSGGQSLRLVADDNYLGLVTVTIAAVN
ncbi:MAG: hypothetical protein ACKOPM_17165 [Novosphingobium sp.]